MPIADTSLSQTFPNNNFGGNGNFISGTGANGLRNRALMQFDVSGGIPAGATVTSATLDLNLVASGTGTGSTFELHRVLQSWGEGTKIGNGGGAATSGEATWNARSAPGTLWNTPGAGSPTDFSATTSGSQFVSAVGRYQFGTTSALVADLQSWLDNSAGNFGWIMVGQSEGVAGTSRRFASREDILNAPMLTIGFTPVPEPSTFCLATFGGLIAVIKILGQRVQQ